MDRNTRNNLLDVRNFCQLVGQFVLDNCNSPRAQRRDISRYKKRFIKMQKIKMFEELSNLCLQMIIEAESAQKTMNENTKLMHAQEIDKLINRVADSLKDVANNVRI